jgi:hypothetical protein
MDADSSLNHERCSAGQTQPGRARSADAASRGRKSGQEQDESRLPDPFRPTTARTRCLRTPGRCLVRRRAGRSGSGMKHLRGVAGWAQSPWLPQDREFCWGQTVGGRDPRESRQDRSQANPCGCDRPRNTDRDEEPDGQPPVVQHHLHEVVPLCGNRAE